MASTLCAAGLKVPDDARVLGSVIGWLLVSFFVLSCNQDNVIISTPPNTGQNQPVVTAAQDLFTFNVNAVGLSFLSSGNVSFTGDSLRYTLSIAGHRTGGGLFRVLDTTDTSLFSDSLSSNRTIVTGLITGRIPARYEISLTNFTGQVSLVLSSAGSAHVFRLEYFPNTIGTSWTYAIFDSIGQRADTAIVTVAGQTIHPYFGPVTALRTAYKNRTDSQYVRISGDTMTIYEENDARSYVFPLSVGQRWTGWFLIDTSIVTQRGTISVPMGSFQNGFKVESTVRGYNIFFRKSVWLVPQVGIVDVRLTVVGIGYETTTWKLLTYHVVP